MTLVFIVRYNIEQGYKVSLKINSIIKKVLGRVRDECNQAHYMNYEFLKELVKLL